MQKISKDKIFAQILTLDKNFISAYDLDLESGKYEIFVKKQADDAGLNARMVNSGNFYEDIVKNVILVVHPDDKDELIRVLGRDTMRERLDKEGYFEYNYRLLAGENTIWAKIRVAYKDNEEHHVIIGTYNADDEMAVKRYEEERNRAILQNNTRIMALEDHLESLYDVELDSGKYTEYVKGEFYQRNVADKLLPKGDYFEDLRGNIDAVIHPEDRDTLFNVLERESIRHSLSQTERIEHYYRLFLDGEDKWFKIRVVYKDNEKKNIIIGCFNAQDEVVKRLQEEQRRQVLISQMAGNEGVFIVDCVNDTRTTLHDSRRGINSKYEQENYSTFMANHIRNYTAKSDQDMMLKASSPQYMLERMKTDNEFTVRFRDILTGRPIFFEMKIVKFSDTQVLQTFTTKDREVISSMIASSIEQDYFALYAVDLDYNLIQIVKDSPYFPQGGIGKVDDFSKSLKRFATFFEGETHDFFEKISDIDFLKQRFKDENKATYSYKASTGQWINVTGYVISRHNNGSPSLFVIGFTFSDSAESQVKEAQHQRFERMKQTMNMFFSLSDEFDPIMVLDPETGEYDWYMSLTDDVNSNTAMSTHGDNLYKDVAIDGATIIHEEDRAKFLAFYTKENMMKIATDGQTQETENRWFIQTENQYKWKYNKVVRMVDETGRVRIVIGVIDTTESKAKAAAVAREKELARQQLEEALKKAEVASNAKSSFLFSMSHDIRTPMNAITGFTTMAKKYVNEPEKVISYLEKIDVSGQQLLMLINQVLEMSRIESGKIEFNERPVNVKERYDTMVTILADHASSRGLEFHSSLENVQHIYILADDTRMSQVTLNVAGNAIKYTPEGGKIDFIVKEIPARREGRATFVFTVQDTGIGMSEEFIKTLYEPFARENTSTVSKIQGTGLGMSIVKNLIDLAGGKIDVESTPGKGTRFDITMDFVIVEQEENENNEPLEAKNLSFNFKGKRALLVEDNEMNREIAKFILEDKGVEIETAEDGDIAIEIIEDMAGEGKFDHFDFILMDVQMPRMDGYKATKVIRSILDPLGIHTPIIALSANAFEEDRKKSIEAGMDGHIAKPIDINQLWETLARFL